MAIPYLPNIPQATDQLSVSQGDILINFQGINTFLNVNHEAFPSANAGKHKFVSFPVQAGNPGTTPTELAMYSKTSTLSAAPELFIQRANNGTVVEFTSSSQTANGWTRLPSGILLKWGTQALTGVTPQVITFPVGANIPVFNLCLNVQLTPFQIVPLGGFIWQLSVFSNINFTVNYTAGATGFFTYFAIGF